MANKSTLITLLVGVLLVTLVCVKSNAELPLPRWREIPPFDSGSTATIYVPDDYSTIQAAVDAANPGDTIIVRAGTYNETVVVSTEGLTIQSEKGPEFTTVRCPDYLLEKVFRVVADDVTLANFKIHGGVLASLSAMYWSSVSLESDRCLVSGNRLLYGDIYVSGSLHKIMDNDILDSFAGIMLYHSNGNKVENNNVSSIGFEGILLEDSNYNIITNNNCSGGVASGIYFIRSSYNELVNNTCSDGAFGIILGEASNNNLFYLNNFIGSYGGAVRVYGILANNWNSPEQITYKYNDKTYTNYLGNYLSDYTGTDADGDGIGDNPYSIDGDKDNYPLMLRFENYEIGGEEPPPENQPPVAPVNLRQLKSDGQTEIPVGGITDGPTVVFKANVSDSDGDSVKLQIELRRLDEYEGQFLNEFTQESDFVPSGSAVTVTAYGLIYGNYHWQASTVDESGLVSERVEFGNNNILENDFEVSACGETPSELAISVIGKDYRIEGGNFCTKGWSNCNNFEVGRFLECYEIDYLDCSGLVYWSYNKASGATEYSPYDPDSYIVTGNMVEFLNPIAFEGANNQYWYNVDRSIGRQDLLPGDLLFFDAEGGKGIDHVAMYVGPFTHEDKQYDVVEATPPKVVPTTVDAVIKRIADFAGAESFKGFGRVKCPVIISSAQAEQIGIILKSPASLIVTDPEGLTITRDLREVPDMIYLQFDYDGDNKDDDFVLVLQRKVGDYSIEIIPDQGVPPTDSYGLEVIADGQNIILAEKVPISQIPEQPYLIQATESEVNVAPIADAAGPYEGITGVPVEFDASGSYDPDGEIVLYEWDWDLDGIYDYRTASSVCEQTWYAEFSGTVWLRVTDDDGLSSIDQVSVVVEIPGPEPVDDLFSISVGRVDYDRRTQQFSVRITVTNESLAVIGSPATLVIETISNPNVTLANADGTTSDDKPYVDLSGLLEDGVLCPGESVTTRLYFNNPNRKLFTFEVSVWGVILLWTIY